MNINPYLFFPGTCEQAFKFYEKALGGKILALIKHSDTPAKDSVDDDWQDKIIHAAMAAGNVTLMASDAAGKMYDKPQGFRVSLGVDDPAEAERIFAALSEGGKIEMPIQEAFFAKRFGQLRDKFGTPWMIVGGQTA